MVLPVAADDVFALQQGLLSTSVTGHLGADNGHGADRDPDGTLLGYLGSPDGLNSAANPFGAYFSNGQLGWLVIVQSGYVTFPVWETASVITTAQGGRVILSTNGNFSYQSPQGFAGVDWFDYTLVDAAYGTDIARVTFNVEATPGANLRPLAADDVFHGSEDTPVTGNVIANDSDPNGDPLSVKAQTFLSANGAIVSLFANGTFAYTPRANTSGADSFTYELRDDKGAIATGTVTLHIGAVNDAPRAVADAFSARHGHTITGNVLANDSDPEGSALTATPRTLTTAKGGVLAILADGSFTYVPKHQYVGADSFTYTVTDAEGASATATVSLTLTNSAPTGGQDDAAVPFLKPCTGNLLANDSDADGDAITAVAGVFTTAHGGTITIAANGNFRYTPPEAFHGTDLYTYQVRDALGAVSSAMFITYTAPPAGSVFGGAGVDVLAGTAGDDVIFGLADDDNISGGLGADTLAGGLDKDTLSGGDGNDLLFGQAGKDVLNGGYGNDRLNGGADGDDLFGGAGGDRLAGGSGIDTLTGGLGTDRFVFDAATGLSADRVEDFAAGDKLCVNRKDYGLAAGALPDPGYFALAGAVSVGHGRFVYNSADRSLRWDADGNAATADTAIAFFNAEVSLSHADFLIL